MRAHTKSVRDRLEDFLLFMNAVATAPPPSLVDERTMRGIHQANNSVIHARGQIGAEMRNLVAIAEKRKSRKWRKLWRERIASRRGIPIFC